jgi:ribosomal protein L11 methyltransferase
MKWIATKVIFDCENTQLAIELIANVFHDLGLKGVVIEDPELEPEEEWGNERDNRPAHHGVIGYFSDNEDAAGKYRQLEKRLLEISRAAALNYEIQTQEIDEEDWAESWKAYFRVQGITDRLTVKPTWREYRPSTDEIILEIDPGMAFGTGAHATTAMCLRLIERYVDKGISFLDIGMGSGILMIAAAKLGAEKLLGVDQDEITLAIADKNLRSNRVPREQYRLRSGNLLDGIDERFDLAVANILVDEILSLLDVINGHLSEMGVFICSGFVQKNRAKILSKMQDKNLTVLKTLEEEDWVAIACTHQRDL